MTIKNVDPEGALLFMCGVAFFFVFQSWLGIPLLLLGGLMIYANTRF